MNTSLIRSFFQLGLISIFFSYIMGCGQNNRVVQSELEEMSKSLPKASNLSEMISRMNDPSFLALAEKLSEDDLRQFYQEIIHKVKTRYIYEINFDEHVEFVYRNLADNYINPDFIQASKGIIPVEYAKLFSITTRYYQNWKDRKNDKHVLKEQSEWDRPFVHVYRIAVLYDRSPAMNENGDVVPLPKLFRKVALLHYIFTFVDSLDQWSGINIDQSAYITNGRRTGTALERLDTKYFSDFEFQSASSGLEEKMVGLGVELAATENGFIARSVVDGSPAQEAGLKNGDVIVAVDGKSVTGSSAAEISSIFGRSDGAQIVLRVKRGDVFGKVTILVREFYNGSVADSKIVDRDQGVGYIRVKRFSQNVNVDLEKAIQKLTADGAKSLILDMRDNPGGLLTKVEEMCELFLTADECVRTEGRTPEDRSIAQGRYQAKYKLPLVVMINVDTVSASEIFANAMKVNERAILVGQKTYGKGMVQTHFPLTSISGDLSITTAEFFGPGGVTMEGVGVSPDVEIALNGSLKDSEDITEILAQRDLELRRATSVASGERVRLIAKAYDGDYGARTRLSTLPKDPFR